METRETEVAVKESTIEYLKRLGMKAAAAKVERLKILKRKMAIAYEHYRFLRPEKINAFNEKLRKQTFKNYTYQQLTMTALQDYAEVPPPEVLKELETALERKCFDAFEVAHIVEVKEDPLLLGVITGCKDKFFIGQWDMDVKIEDILRENEG